MQINLGLHIVGKRDDGYHDLETVFYPLPLKDILEIIHGEQSSKITISGLPVAGDTSSNLCIKALQLLQKDFPQLADVKIHLHKNIPMGAGLGGGSADGAFMLKLLNQFNNLGLSDAVLADYSLQLGSDCPFFIYNKPAFATGRGEKLEPINLNLEKYSFLLIDPGVHISTAESFSGIKPKKASVDLREAVTEPIYEWRQLVTNDFEEPAFFHHPELKEIKSFLYDAGAIYASMTGTGSCFYGIFENNSLPDCKWNSFKIPAASTL